MAIGTTGEQGRKAGPELTSEQVWQAIARASFAVVSHVTPAGEPRSSGVVYKATRHRLVVAVAPGGWKGDDRRRIGPAHADLPLLMRAGRVPGEVAGSVAAAEPLPGSPP